MRPATLPLKHTRAGSFASARDAQSIPFLSTAGNELLYSGLEMRKP